MYTVSVHVFINRHPSVLIHDMSHIAHVLPSALTFLGLWCGLASLFFALQGEFFRAYLCVCGAAFFDSVDGYAARALNACSRFGSELDSLCDLVDFGVAPAVITYLWAREQQGTLPDYILQGACILYVSCCAYRLARFNVTETASPRETGAPSKAPFFQGLPSPAAGFLAFFPMMMTFLMKETGRAAYLGTIKGAERPCVVVTLLLLSLLMISSLPTGSAYGLYERVRGAGTPGLSIGFLIACMGVVYPLHVYVVLALLYCMTFPLSYCQFHLKDTPAREDGPSRLTRRPSTGHPPTAYTTTEAGGLRRMDNKH